MHLVQLLLPLCGPDGRKYSRELYDELGRVLTERFGGVTAYSRAPAVGLWEDRPGRTQRDDIVVLEVMVETIEGEWWAARRRDLEARLGQAEIVIRALPMTRL